MKAVYLFLLFSIISVLGFAQTNEFEPASSSFPEVNILDDTIAPAEQTIQIQPAKVKFGMSFGTYFATNFGGGYQYGTFLSPHVTYPVSKRFSLSVGAQINNSMGNMYYQPFDRTLNSGYRYQPVQSMLYVQGAYRLSENVTVRGATYRTVNFSGNSNQLNGNINRDYSGLIMGVDYKLGKNVFLQGQIEFSNGRGANQYNPFYNGPGFPNSNSPFGDRYGFGR